MVQWLDFSLRAWDLAGRHIPPAEFLDRLLIRPGDPASVEDGPGDPRVRLLSVAQDDFSGVDITADAGARSEA
jgi:hypothetical protein